MKIRYWGLVLIVLFASQFLAAVFGELIFRAVVEPYLYKSVRARFDDQTLAWQQQLRNPVANVDDTVALLRSELMYDVRKGLIDALEAEEALGVPGLYYALREEAGVIVAVVLNDREVVEFGPVPGTILQSNLEVILRICVSSLLGLLGLYLLLLPIRTRLKGVVDMASASLDLPAEQNKGPILELLVDRATELAQKVQYMRVETTTNIDNQRDFLHGVAHEFRAPLAQLRFALDLEDEESPERIDRIVEDMDELITEILEYSRFRHGLFVPNIESINLAYLLGQSLKEFDVDKRIEFVIGAGLNERTSLVNTDAALVKRCITNLVHNALRYSKSQIFVDLITNADSLTVVIEDDGPGVPPGKREIIFEAFTRLDPSRSRSSGGTGLGLAIVDGIAKKLGAKVSVMEGSTLTGACFTFTIPR